ncbi:MAG TPA: TIR domain-containing protein [Caulobacteraceae bacterium]|jgi:hypothetical protein
MSGVFLSYSRGDRDLANAIIRGLRAVGVTVWWDEDMHSIDWNKELERQIVELATVVVLWTPNSANSDNVKDEARLGLEHSKLINVIVGLPKPPYPFDRVNGLPLEGWHEHEPTKAWNRLVQSVEEKVVAAGGAAKGEFTAALARREENLKQRRETLARAQEALEEAQAREGETTEAAQIAQTAFTRAEEQHVRVMEMRPSHLIMSAAAQEFEAARAAKEDSDRALRAAKAEVKGATREVALAKAALESPEAEASHRRHAAPPSAKTAESVASAPAASAATGAGVKAAAKAAPPTPPAPSPMAAPAAPAPTPPAGSRSRNLMFGASAVVMAGIAGAGLMMLNQRHATPPPAAAPAAASTKTSASAEPKAAAVTAAAGLAGNWAPPGLGCGSPIVIAIKDGAVAMSVAGTTSTAAIQASPAPGEIDATADDGGKYVYKLGHDNSLSMTGPGDQSMKLTKCAG